jgi:hypothetical protein
VRSIVFSDSWMAGVGRQTGPLNERAAGSVAVFFRHGCAGFSDFLYRYRLEPIMFVTSMTNLREFWVAETPIRYKLAEQERGFFSLSDSGRPVKQIRGVGAYRK